MMSSKNQPTVGAVNSSGYGRDVVGPAPRPPKANTRPATRTGATMAAARALAEDRVGRQATSVTSWLGPLLVAPVASAMLPPPRNRVASRPIVSQVDE